MSSLTARMKRSPRRKRFTPKQEAQLEKAERMHGRAEILERGVAAALVTGINLSIAVEVLQEADTLRKEGYAIKATLGNGIGRGIYA